LLVDEIRTRREKNFWLNRYEGSVAAWYWDFRGIAKQPV
jgi:predicted chitinase